MFFSKMTHWFANLPIVKKALTENRFFIRMYFNWRYRKSDPYNVSISEYETEKTERSIRSLKFQPKFGSILEIGCGEGNMTTLLAAIAEKVVATDISDLAVKRTAVRTSAFSNVEARRMDLLADEAPGEFDLVVASEVLYYFEQAQLPAVMERVTSCVKKGGSVGLIHARALADDTAGVELKKFGARTIHEMFIGDPRYSVILDDMQPKYRITVLRRTN